MVKTSLILSSSILISFLVGIKNDNEYLVYKNIFHNVSMNSSFKSIEINEDSNLTAKFNKEKLNLYFHTDWQTVCLKTPSLLSIVTYDEETGVSDKYYGTSVQIKIVISGSFKKFQYETQYTLKIKGEMS